MTDAKSIEKAMKKHIDDAARETNGLKKRNDMFKAEPVAYDLLNIGVELGRAVMCCDILRTDFNQDVSDYTGIIEEIKTKAYETYKEITGGI